MTPWIIAKFTASVLAFSLIACGGTEADPGAQEGPGEVAASDLERELNPEVDTDEFQQFTADNRDFAYSLLEQIRSEEGDDENVFLSPHSVSIALAMTYGGAANNTKAEMADVLRFQLDDDSLHPSFNKLDLELATRSDFESDDGEAFELDVVNQTWGQEDFHFEEDYLDLLALNYGASMRVVDFISDYEEIRKDINSWVEDQTNDRIEDLLPERSLNHLTRFVLVNAIYFYGSWKHPFDEDATSEQPFTRLDDSTVDVDLMTEENTFARFEGGDTIAASLPYVGDDVSLIAYMPADEEADFLEWEEEFERQDFDEIVDGLSFGPTRIYFPRLEDEGGYDLVETFEEMGMVDPFDDCAADFRYITGAEPCIPLVSLYISGIFHKTFVKIDEEGTEAAAATAVVMGTADSEPPPAEVIRFDRPFHYVIYDHPTDTILFMGRMVDPS